jgi:hypothetical protein
MFEAHPVRGPGGATKTLVGGPHCTSLLLLEDLHPLEKVAMCVPLLTKSPPVQVRQLVSFSLTRGLWCYGRPEAQVVRSSDVSNDQVLNLPLLSQGAYNFINCTYMLPGCALP